MSSKVISAFAGVGKTTVAKKYPNIVCDLESSDYQWIYDTEEVEGMDKENRKGATQRRANPEWPSNYLQAIKSNSQRYDIILISQQKDMRDFLAQNGVQFALCFPSTDCKQSYIDRYRARGNQQRFVDLMEENFENWVKLLEQEDGEKIVLSKGQHLEDKLRELGLLPSKSMEDDAEGR